MEVSDDVIKEVRIATADNIEIVHSKQKISSELSCALLCNPESFGVSQMHKTRGCGGNSASVSYRLALIKLSEAEGSLHCYAFS